MTRDLLFALTIVSLAFGQLACGTSGAPNQQITEKTVSAPSQGPGGVRSLLKSRFGSYELKSKVRLREIEQEIPNAIDGAGTVYYSAGGGTVQHLLVEFPSASLANDELQSALRRYQSVGKTVKLGVVKNAEGGQLGQEFMMKDEVAEALHWTNGPLYCIAQSETGSALDFAQLLPYHSTAAGD